MYIFMLIYVTNLCCCCKYISETSVSVNEVLRGHLWPTLNPRREGMVVEVRTWQIIMVLLRLVEKRKKGEKNGAKERRVHNLKWALLYKIIPYDRSWSTSQADKKILQNPPYIYYCFYTVGYLLFNSYSAKVLKCCVALFTTFPGSLAPKWPWKSKMLHHTLADF